MNRRLFFGLLAQVTSAAYLAGCSTFGKNKDQDGLGSDRSPSGRRYFNGYDENGYGTFSFGYGYGPISYGYNSRKRARRRQIYGYGYGTPCYGYANELMYCPNITWIQTIE